MASTTTTTAASSTVRRIDRPNYTLQLGIAHAKRVLVGETGRPAHSATGRVGESNIRPHIRPHREIAGETEIAGDLRSRQNEQ